MRCETYPLNELKTYRFVVVFSFYKGKILLSRHKKRTTWETQGGHIEPGETPLEAAKRELFEESGARVCMVRPAFDYWAGDESDNSNGMVFTAFIDELGALPESEMAETCLFDRLPENLTYPDITPILYSHLAQKTLLFLGDSITDCGRLYPAYLENGYVSMLGEDIKSAGLPFQLVNKGHDGLTLPRLVKNLPVDCYPKNADITGVLIGVNDTAVCMITGKSLEEMDFAGQYELLIQNILSNTKTKLFCMGPFLFPHPQEYAGWLPVICRMEEIIEDLARKYALPFLPLQERLNEAADEYGYDAITADGVHLTIE